MTQTLRSLIAENTFTGYRIQSAAWHVGERDIEFALYGNCGDSWFEEGTLERFTDANQFEVIEVNTWACSDGGVGLEVLRLQGAPVALLWQSAGKSSKEITFLSEEKARVFLRAWEAAKRCPEEQFDIADDFYLDMPIAEPGTEPFEIDSSFIGRPHLTPSGIAYWVKAEGGQVDAIEHRGALEHAKSVLDTMIKVNEDTVANFEAQENGPVKHSKTIAGMRKTIANYTGARQMLIDRLAELG